MTDERKAMITTGVLALIAFSSIANGAWMLATPLRWYKQVPAEVPDFGPYSEHFVRDIGCAYSTVGLALAWAVRSASVRLPLVVVAAWFYGLHALVHVFDTAREFVAPSHWLVDLPTTYLPGILLAVIATNLFRGRARNAHFVSVG